VWVGDDLGGEAVGNERTVVEYGQPIRDGGEKWEDVLDNKNCDAERLKFENQRLNSSDLMRR